MFILFYSARASKCTQSRLLELDGSKYIKNTFRFPQHFAPVEISTSNLVGLDLCWSLCYTKTERIFSTQQLLMLTPNHERVL